MKKIKFEDIEEFCDDPALPGEVTATLHMKSGLGYRLSLGSGHDVLSVVTGRCRPFYRSGPRSFVSQITAAADTSNSLSDAFGFALLSITLIVLTWQMPNIASGIAGGAAVSGATGWAAAMVATMRGRGGSSDRPSSAKGGGEVTGTSGPADRSLETSSPKGRTPAHRRATLDRLSKRK